MYYEYLVAAMMATPALLIAKILLAGHHWSVYFLFVGLAGAGLYYLGADLTPSELFHAAFGGVFEGLEFAPRS